MTDEPLIPENEHALVDAARRRGRDRAASMSGRRRLRRLPRRTGLFAALVVLAGGTATASTAWMPQLGDEARGRPRVERTNVPLEQRDALAVLRREQTATDRGPDIEKLLKLLCCNVSGVWTDGVRSLGADPINDVRFVLIPVRERRLGKPQTFDEPRRGRLCLYAHYRTSGAGGSCGTVDDLRAGRIAMGFGDGRPQRVSAGSPRPRMGYAQLVPDGVVTARLRLRGGVIETVTVKNNLIVLGRARDGFVQTTWLDAAGREVPKLRVPRPNVPRNPRPCGLTVSVRHLGERRLRFGITNPTRHACRLWSSPRVRLSNRAGDLTDFAQVLPGHGLRMLAPGDRASLILDGGRCATNRSVDVAFLGLSRGNAIRVRLPAEIDAATCERAMRTSPIVAVH